MEDSSNNFLCSKDGRCSKPGWGADTEMWLGSVPWQSMRVLYSTRGPGTFSEACQIRHRLASSHNGGILLTHAQFSGGNWQERRKQNKQPNPYTPYKSDLVNLPQGCQKVEKMIPRPLLGNLIFNVEKIHPITWLSTCFLSPSHSQDQMTLVLKNKLRLWTPGQSKAFGSLFREHALKSLASPLPVRCFLDYLNLRARDKLICLHSVWGWGARIPLEEWNVGKFPCLASDWSLNES